MDTHKTVSLAKEKLYNNLLELPSGSFFISSILSAFLRIFMEEKTEIVLIPTFCPPIFEF
jgi:hypothetical protein